MLRPTTVLPTLVLLLAACSAGEPGRPSAPDAAPGTTAAVQPEQPADQPAAPAAEKGDDVSDPTTDETQPAAPAGRETATFGAGCYWCVEAVYEQFEGVYDVRSGFMGGEVENPSYEAVCAGITGHAEVVQFEYDPSKISYEKLLHWFWKLHDPTTLNRQGADVGTQYRSAIFYHSDAQRAAAEKSKAAADASGEFDDPIVTEITAAAEFYEAKASHQDFYRQNKTYGYCRAVIVPKLEKLGLEK